MLSSGQKFQIAPFLPRRDTQTFPSKSKELILMVPDYPIKECRMFPVFAASTSHFQIVTSLLCYQVVFLVAD